MRGRVFLTAAYHRDTGALSEEEAIEAAQYWTYRGTIEPLSFPIKKRGPRGEITTNHGNQFPLEGVIMVTDAVVSGPETRAIGTKRVNLEWNKEEPCSDVVLPWHSVRLIEVDDS